MDLSIITVTHNSKEMIDTCILSVRSHTLFLAYEHIIIDNGSTDETAAYIEENYSHLCKLVINRENQGFSTACNQGQHLAHGRYILFLNPDMQIHSGYLDDLLGWAEKQNQLGIASCKLVTKDLLPHHALRPHRFPTLLPYLSCFLGFRPLFCTIHPQFFYHQFDDNQEREVDVVRGAFMLMRKETLDHLGQAFDIGYFLLFEDVDLCRRIQTIGLKVMYTPQIICIDYMGMSFSKKSTFFKHIHLSKSLLRYVFNWHNPCHLLWLSPLIFLYMTCKKIFMTKKNGWRFLHLCKKCDQDL